MTGRGQEQPADPPDRRAGDWWASIDLDPDELEWMEAAAAGAASAPGPHAGPAYCRACSYELTGLQAALCPECGEAFDLADPATFDHTPYRERLRTRVRRGAILFLVLALVFAGFYYTVLPRPISMSQPTLLVWFGKSYGREIRVRPSVRVYWFADRCQGVDLLRDVDGSVEARLRRTGGRGDWRLDVLAAGVSVGELLLAVNTYSEPTEFFGIQIETAGSETSGPFSAQGGRADILSALFRNAGVDRITPMLLEGHDGRVWVWDDEAGALERVTIEEAAAMGFDELEPVSRRRFDQLESPTVRRRW